MEELKPCPFCGGEAEIYEYDPDGLCDYHEPYTVQCKAECCLLGRDFATPEEAAEAWNRGPTMVLIEREALVKAFADADPDVMADYGLDYGSEWGFSREAVEKVIQSIPIIDAAPVVHGRWIYNTERNKWVCDKCNASAMPSREQFEQYNTKFCPNCGARMIGG